MTGLAQNLASGGYKVLQAVGVVGTNKRQIQLDYIKKVLHNLEYQVILPKSEYYLDLAQSDEKENGQPQKM